MTWWRWSGGRTDACLDTVAPARDTISVVWPGRSRHSLAQTLNAAYADGLLSADTLSHRLDRLYSSLLLDPEPLIGDLSQRTSHRGLWSSMQSSLAPLVQRLLPPVPHDRWVVLALDWSGGCDELLVGRGLGCDVVLPNAEVSRRHARLRFRDGKWILEDLQSRNGTTVNQVRVGRCELLPGDRIVIGGHHLEVD